MVNVAVSSCPTCIFSGMKTHLTSTCQDSAKTIAKDAIKEAIEDQWQWSSFVLGSWSDVEAELSTAADTASATSASVAVDTCKQCFGHGMDYLADSVQCYDCGSMGTAAINGIASTVKDLGSYDATVEGWCHDAVYKLIGAGTLTISDSGDFDATSIAMGGVSFGLSVMLPSLVYALLAHDM